MANDNNKGKGAPDILTQVANRIRECSNVLVALSKNPSIDELTAALGLTFVLDKMGKRATAIFSGDIPNIIEFLQPEKTFEQNTNSLQDFIIALDKEKADHIRYKIDGDYVKVYITPYKTTISEKDMEFSHGDFNVDLVISLNVASAKDLDGALTEYGRIMHDASSINISAAAPGKFADLEWGSPEASSISEMISILSNELREPDNPLMDNNIATTLLTGIISATNRFSNERTTADTLATASALMAEGADQQLISKNVPVDILTQKPEPKEEEPEEKKEESKEEKTESEEKTEEKSEPESEKKEEPAKPVDPTDFAISHRAEKKEEKVEAPAPETPVEEKPVEAPESPAEEDNKDIAIPKPEHKTELEERLENKVNEDEAATKQAEENNDIKLDDDDGGAKRNIAPLEQAMLPPEPPKDYAQMLDTELKASGADKMYVPSSVDDSPTLRSTDPAPAPMAPPRNVEVPAAEIGPSGILPPPPVPLSAMMPPSNPEPEEPKDIFEEAGSYIPTPSVLDESKSVPKEAPTKEAPVQAPTPSEPTPAPAEEVGHIPTANEIVAKLQKEKAEQQKKATEVPVMPAVKLQIPSQPTAPAPTSAPATPAAQAPVATPAPSAPAGASLAPRPSTPPTISAASVPGANSASAAPAPSPAPAPTPSTIQDDPGAFHIPGM
ncbi:hypothetical protein IKM56_00640 [Candidatus Saccharibacteria bacterium]|nr:hypothetical protein [Candidatus Saccharibacteria bacterium]